MRKELMHTALYSGMEYSDELYHFKYLDRYKSKAGKWIYVYSKSKLKTSSSNGVKQVSYGKGEYENFKGVTGQKVSNKKSTNVSLTAYKNNGNKKSFDVSKKIGGVKVYAGRDSESSYAGVSVDKSHISKKLNKGKSHVSKFLKKKLKH